MGLPKARYMGSCSPIDTDRREGGSGRKTAGLREEPKTKGVRPPEASTWGETTDVEPSPGAAVRVGSSTALGSEIGVSVNR